MMFCGLWVSFAETPLLVMMRFLLVNLLGHRKSWVSMDFVVETSCYLFFSILVYLSVIVLVLGSWLQTFWTH